MLIVVNHKISNVGAFWGAAEKELKTLPSGLKLHISLPNSEMNLATCVWEAPSVDQLQKWLEEKTSQWAKNEYQPVDTSKAINPPK